MKNCLSPFAAALLTAACSAPLAAAVTFPNEFENPSDALGPMYAYFGGVTSWSTALSSTTIHTGNSLQVNANLVNDQFAVAAFAVGTFGITSPNLSIPAGADTFSITIKGPESGVLSLNIFIREDDNNDNVININGPDDEWESGILMIKPGVNVYNIPYATFQDSNPDNGNGLQNFNTTGRLAYILEFASRDSYPGGQIIGPVSLFIDHCGFYVGAQSVPPLTVEGDLNDDGVVNVDDLVALLAAWGTCTKCPADFNGDGLVNVDDLVFLLAHWG